MQKLGNKLFLFITLILSIILADTKAISNDNIQLFLGNINNSSDSNYKQFELIMNNNLKTYLLRFDVHTEIKGLILQEDISYGSFDENSNTINLKDFINNSKFKIIKITNNKYRFTEGLLLLKDLDLIREDCDTNSSIVEDLEYYSSYKNGDVFNYQIDSSKLSSEFIIGAYKTNKDLNQLKIIFNNDNSYEYYLNKLLIYKGHWIKHANTIILEDDYSKSKYFGYIYNNKIIKFNKSLPGVKLDNCFYLIE